MKKQGRALQAFLESNGYTYLRRNAKGVDWYGHSGHEVPIPVKVTDRTVVLIEREVCKHLGLPQPGAARKRHASVVKERRAKERHRLALEVRTVVPHRFVRDRPDRRPPLLLRATTFVSAHAVERWEWMTTQLEDLDSSEVSALFHQPDRFRFSVKHGSWIWFGPRIAIPIRFTQDGTAVVTTFLWATRELFERYPRPTTTKGA